MKDKMMRVFIRLAVCPGEYNNSTPSEMCTGCDKCGVADCANQLKLCAVSLLGEPKSTERSSVTLETRVTEILHEIGVPAHIKGYRYVRSAIVQAVQDREVLEYMTKELYPQVAGEFDTTPSRVERAIRHAVEVAWNRGDFDVLQRWFGHTVSSQRGKPTNGEFISMLVDKICLEMQEVQRNG